MTVFWVCLELNMLRFLPLISLEGGLAIENSIKYFLIQRIASIVFLSFTLLNLFRDSPLVKTIILLSIILKLGVAPLHGWFISLIRESTARVILYLSTVQKIIPLIVLRNLEVRDFMLTLLAILTISIVWTGGITLVRLNSILGLSSVSNLLWFLTSAQLRVSVILTFFFLYRIILIGVLRTVIDSLGIRAVTQISSMTRNSKLVFRFFFMSLGGLPPFLGFLAKVIVLKLLLRGFSTLFLLILVLRALIILLYYTMFSILRLTLTFKLKRLDSANPTWARKKVLFFTLLRFNALVLIKI